VHLLRTVWRRERWVCRRTLNWPNSDSWRTASVCWWVWPKWLARFQPPRLSIWIRRVWRARPLTEPAPYTSPSPVGRAAAACRSPRRWRRSSWRRDLPRLTLGSRPLRYVTATAVAETWQHRIWPAHLSPAIGRRGLCGVAVPSFPRRESGDGSHTRTQIHVTTVYVNGPTPTVVDGYRRATQPSVFRRCRRRRFGVFAYRRKFDTNYGRRAWRAHHTLRRRNRRSATARRLDGIDNYSP